MDRAALCAKINEAISTFNTHGGDYVQHGPYGSGHINDTFFVDFEKRRYIIQRMNHDIFKNPEQLMSNIVGVTEFLSKKGAKTLNVVKTKDDKSFYKDSIGSYWRMYEFIDNAKTFDRVENIKHFAMAGKAFGEFQKQLSDYPCDTLYETIKDFHNTPVRYQTFLKAVDDDACKRLSSVEREVGFIKEREKLLATMVDMQKNKELPVRVTHNDTKLNNVMIDEVSGVGVCVIDLDTVMPGLSGNDFGDAIRFGCNPASEDERDLSLVKFNEDYYKAFYDGFLGACDGALTQNEVKTLPMGAVLMTLECGMRFLTDYLQGDTYFKIHREGHNLDRCRTQFKMVSDMEKLNFV